MATGESAVATSARNGGIAVGVAAEASAATAVADAGGIAAAAAAQDSTATAIADGDLQLAAAAFSSSATAIPGVKDCEGPGLALAAGSDGTFCVSVLGLVVGSG